MQNKIVSVTNVNSYNQDELIANIKRHFELLGLNDIIKPNMRVLLKPNLLMKRKPEEVTTTNPAVIAAIVSCLHTLGVTDIILADSPGGPYTKQALNSIYETCGMAKMAKEMNVKLNTDVTYYEQKVKNGKMVQSFTLINPIRQADFIINIAKLKTHSMTTLSGAVKNLFGTVPGLMKPEFHFRFPDKVDFSNMLLDLCETVMPNVTFVDAVVSMEGDGPSGGTPRQTGLIIAGCDPYALDMVLCKVINIQPQNVITVNEAIKRQLCAPTIDKVEIIGDEIGDTSDYKLPKSSSVDFMQHIPKVFQTALQPIANKFLVSKPFIRKKDCIGCGKCMESCPAKTITIIDKKASISYNKCIRCFCCHEMCPVKAISIKRLKLFNI